MTEFNFEIKLPRQATAYPSYLRDINVWWCSWTYGWAPAKFTCIRSYNSTASINVVIRTHSVEAVLWIRHRYLPVIAKIRFEYIEEVNSGILSARLFLCHIQSGVNFKQLIYEYKNNGTDKIGKSCVWACHECIWGEQKYSASPSSLSYVTYFLQHVWSINTVHSVLLTGL